MAITFQCECGALRGEIEPHQVYARATCYCRDCQAFARALRREAVLDPDGGTDIIAMLPAAVRFTAGIDQLACLSLSPKGLLRWYSRCCDTPLANTARNPTLAYVGLQAHCLHRGELDAAVGQSRIALNTKSARRPVAPTPLRTFMGVARIMRGVLVARLLGRNRRNPFFDMATARPVAEPRVLTRRERVDAAPPR